MKKCLSQSINKCTFLSHRQTLHDEKCNNGISARFATQYQLTLEDLPQESRNLEIVRLKEKYRCKCEEVDQMRKQIQAEKISIDQRNNKISKNEQELRQLAMSIQDKLQSLQNKEESLQEKVQNYEEKYKIRENVLIEKQNSLLERERQLKMKEQQMEIRQKTLDEKEYLMNRKVEEQQDLIEKLQIQFSTIKEKEQYYHGQIEKLNEGLSNLLQQEMQIKNIQFGLSQQIQKLRELECAIVISIQDKKNQEEQYDQMDMKIQLSEEMFNRKLEYDLKHNSSKRKPQKQSRLTTENSNAEISNFAYSSFQQKC